MAEERYCPLTYAIGKGAYDQEISNFDSCVKEKCELWIPGEFRCSFRLLAEALNQIANHSKFQ